MPPHTSPCALENRLKRRVLPSPVAPPDETRYINLDYIARVTPSAWDEWGGHIVLKDGSVFVLRKDVFDRLK